MKLAEVVGRHAWTFALSDTPAPDSIQVALDGVTLASGWTYDPVGNTVRLDPVLGSSSLTVTYSVADSCP